ncbi:MULTISPECIES: biliverdin-producing heme oxygenase [unclassified Thioalkalivibrio]|uniref:biliverdin-producing heme oxygenase n=1 Tax=unclassified Thioalkalivibrio TaxID=2621013 RepID=UPI00037D3E94
MLDGTGSAQAATIHAMRRYHRGRAHQALRRGTAPAHKALDQHRLMQQLTGRALTREQYAESLAAMCRPHARLERRVHASRHHAESGFELSPRLARLEADLVELGQPVPPVSQTPPDLSGGRAAWWGRVYVLEGSRQGSAVIARCIHSSLGDTVPCRFFGETIVPDDFGRLLATLERELEVDDALEQAVAGAREAFADYQAELDAFDSRERAVEMR